MPDLRAIDDIALDGLTKGLPGNTRPFRLGEIGAKGWNVLAGDLTLPLAVLKDSALRHNSAWMRRFLALSGASLSPHGKTTMSPQLFARQIEDGAWAITVATVQQLEICRRFGFGRVILANQLTGARATDYVLDILKADPGFDFYCLVDSLDGVRALAGAAAEAGLDRPLQVLLEGGTRGGRTGARELGQALAVARAVAEASPHLALRGVEGFEGLIPGDGAGEQETQVG